MQASINLVFDQFQKSLLTENNKNDKAKNPKGELEELREKIMKLEQRNS